MGDKMQIYNFEKHRKIIKEELKNRLNNNKEKIKFVTQGYKREGSLQRDYIYGKNKEIYNIEELNKNFIHIQNKTIGVKDLDSNYIYKNISNKNLDFDKFVNCDFNHIKFENCSFCGTAFSNCKLKNVYFSHCNFESELGIAALFNENCIFENCTFHKTNLKNTIFDNDKFVLCKLNLSSLRNVIFNNSLIENIIFSDCDLKSMKTIDTNINYLAFEDEYLSKVDENTFVDILKFDKDKNTYENIFKSYKSISAVFEKNGLFNYSGEYYYLSKCAERRCLTGLDKLKSNLFYYICGYGERPTFALITSLEIVLIFAILYMFCGLCINERIIHYNPNILSYLPRKLMYMDLVDCFYFSLVTFTSVGYGDIFPIGYSVILSCIEMILGVTMVGVWTATLARKITR